MSKTRVLLVCYYFPPLGGAGVGRPLTLYKYLPQHGVECDVLTVKPVAYRQYEPELLEGIESGRVYRSGSRDPQRLMYMLGIRKVKDSSIRRGKKVSVRFFPDPKVGWVRPAVKLGRVLAENRHYSCIISTSPPISAHLVAKQLAREFGMPWIADFRDFWTGYKAEDWFDDDRRIERAKDLLVDIKKSASAVTVVNPAIAEYLGVGDVVYNSFDESRAGLWKRPDDMDKFGIGVLGTIDELRPIEPLFKLMSALREKAPDMFDRLRIIQVGQINHEGFDSLIDSNGLRDKCECHGPQGRERTIEILSETSMLYIGLASPHGNGVLPGRLFDMIASGRPILAAVPEGGVVEQLVKETGNGFCFDSDAAGGAVGYVNDLIHAHISGETTFSSPPTYADRYSSTRLVVEIKRVIDRIS